MTWSAALRWSVPVTIVVLGAVGAIILLSDYIEQVGEPEAMKRFAIVSVTTYLGMALLLKQTADSISAWKSAYRSSSDDHL